MSTLLYLHGFRSSPRSTKAQQMRQYLAEQRPDIQFVCPQLAATPDAAWGQISTIADTIEGPFGVVGSSLGGFFATRVAEIYGCYGVVINPAVNPHILLRDYLGEQQHPYTHEQYCLTECHMQELAALKVTAPTAMERLWLLQQQEDEVLDYREALDYYRFARVCMQKGGNHAFMGFEHYRAQIVRFLQL